MNRFHSIYGSRHGVGTVSSRSDAVALLGESRNHKHTVAIHAECGSRLLSVLFHALCRSLEHLSVALAYALDEEVVV